MAKPPAPPIFPAFPTSPSDADGMTLRDYFAAHALSGMLAAATSWRSHDAAWAARVAYEFAEAMANARLKATPYTTPVEPDI